MLTHERTDHPPPIKRLKLLNRFWDLHKNDPNDLHNSGNFSFLDMRGRRLADSINSSTFGILNWDTTTRLLNKAGPSSPDVSLASASLISSNQLADEVDPRLRSYTNPNQIADDRFLFPRITQILHLPQEG